MLRSLSLGILAIFAALQHTLAAGPAPCPAYVVIRPTTQGPVQPAPAKSYAYGWFGVRTAPQHYSQSGYKRDWAQKVYAPSR